MKHPDRGCLQKDFVARASVFFGCQAAGQKSSEAWQRHVENFLGLATPQMENKADRSRKLFGNSP
jgi:hypothetical protein